MVQNLWDEEKAVLRGKLMVSNNRNLHLKELEEEHTKSQISRNKEIIKIKEEINEIEKKNKTKTQNPEKIDETNSSFLEFQYYFNV